MKKAILSFVSFSVLLFTLCFSASAVENVTFNTVDGGTTSIYSENYDLTINVFGVVDLVYSEDFLNFILSEGIDKKNGIKVNFINTNNDSKEVVEKFRQEKFCKFYPDNKISFCYSPTYEGGYIRNMLIDAYEEDIDRYESDICYINKNGKIVWFTDYFQEKNEILKIVNYKNSLLESAEFSVEGKENYDYAYEVLDKLNALRSSLNLPTLVMDKELLEVAMQRAAEISIYYSHSRPDGSSCFTTFNKPGTLAENIALGQKSPTDVIEDWTNSPGHYSNMTLSTIKSVGIGVFEASDGTLCWVQYFHSGENEHYTTTGIKESQRQVVADFRHLSLSFSNETNDTHILKKGETVSFFVFNNNIITKTRQKLSVSDFEVKAHNNNISVSESNAVTVNNEVPFSAEIKIISKNNPDFYYDTETTIGHTHNYLDVVTMTLKHSCGFTEIRTHYVCDICYENRTEDSFDGYHELTEEVIIKPATETEDGKMGLTCSDCLRKKETYPIPRISEILIPQTEFIYKGTEIVPTVTIKDSEGNILKENTDYLLSVQTGYSPTGKSRYQIYFINKYKGEKLFDITVRSGAPSKITLIPNNEDNSIYATWDSVPGAYVYNVELIKNGKTVESVKVEETGWTFDGLSENVVYKVRVTSISGNGNLYSTENTVAETIISSESATEPSAGETHKHTEVIIPAVESTYTEEGLSEGKKCSKCGKVLVKQKKTARKKLSKVKGLKIKSIKTTSVKASWSKVKGAESYKVMYSKNGKKWASVITTKTSITIKKLSSGTSYRFKVKAQAGKFSGNTGSIVKATTKLKKPVIKSLKSSKSEQAVVTWNKAPSSNGYIVEYSTSKKFTEKSTSKKAVSSGKSTKATLKKLKSGKKYYVRIKAYKTVNKKNIYSSYSSVKSVKVK